MTASWDQNGEAPRRPATVACATLVALALLTFAISTHQGIGIFTDSTRYMGISAREYDAPLYHWLLVAGPAFGLSLTGMATLVAVVTLCANIVLIFGLVQRATGRWQYATMATALASLSPQFVTLHTAAMSEPLFLMLVLLTMWTALSYFESGSRRMLMASGVMLGLATLARFAAPPLGAAIVLLIMLDRRVELRQRLGDCLRFAGVSGAIFLAWVIASQLSAGRSIGRDLWFYGNMAPSDWVAAGKAMMAWLLPDAVPTIIRLPLLIGVLGFAMWQAVRQLSAYASRSDDGQHGAGSVLTLLLALFFIGYMAFIWLSVMIEANLRFTGRYALPAYVILLMLVTIQVRAMVEVRSARSGLWLGFIGLACVLLAGHAVRTASRTAEVFREGYGYQSALWRNSPTIAAVRQLPAKAQIYSNGPDIIAYLTGKTADFSPHERLLRTDLPEKGNPVETQFERLLSVAQSDPVYIVMFDNVEWRFYLASEKRLVAGLPLTQIGKFNDGRIYKVEVHAPSVPQ
jgi:Dolichyl-phosphate-mannose-protein mannosyltransferase